MREQEYAADAMAAQITSPDSLASALLRLQIGANYMAKTYWPSISKQMLISQSMNVSPVKDTAKSLINLYDSQEVPRWLNAGKNWMQIGEKTPAINGIICIIRAKKCKQSIKSLCRPLNRGL